MINILNADAFCGEHVFKYVAQDQYVRQHNNDQLRYAREKIYNLMTYVTGGLPYMLQLLVKKPYIACANIDVLNRPVKVTIGM